MYNQQVLRAALEVLLGLHTAVRVKLLTLLINVKNNVDIMLDAVPERPQRTVRFYQCQRVRSECSKRCLSGPEAGVRHRYLLIR